MPSVQAKGTSLWLLLHSLRKRGYCPAYTAGRKGPQVGLEMAESTDVQKGCIWDLEPSLPHLRLQLHKRCQGELHSGASL